MKTPLRILLLLAFLASPAAFARVVSYAPYSEALATRAQHSRTSRYVLAIEGRPINSSIERTIQARLVLHDTTGAEEPRVVLRSDSIEAAALFEPGNGAPPMLLAASSNRVVLSTDAGINWREVLKFDTDAVIYQPRFDNGGPFTRGLGGPIQTGTASWPFVVDVRAGEVIAIGADGRTRMLAAGSKLVGRNREGTRFLVSTGNTVTIVDLEGRIAPVATDVTPDEGWITSEGSVYLLVWLPNGARRLRLYEHQQEAFKTGRYLFFAIPTHDFDGAWMIQQDGGDPSLSRHVPGGAEEVFWTDTTLGREIEAIIAGPSGRSVLIQTAILRETAETTPFRGIGVAVWQPGQPAPASYDEIHARLGTNHGFAHVDPDTVAEGSLFVFDSALREWQKGSGGTFLGSREGPGGADVLQEWGLLRASLRQRLIIPAVSRVEGGYGTHWLTDLVLHNPFEVKQDVTLRFEQTAKTLTLDPDEIRVVADVLGTLFGVERGGGPLFVDPQTSMTVSSRTYTRSGGGTLGYTMDAVDALNTAGAGFPFAFSAAFPGTNFRTNMLLTDLSGRGSQVTLHGFTTHEPVYVAPTATLSLGRVDGWLGTRGGLFVEPLSGNLLTTVVAIDNATNDATYFPPDRVNNDAMSRTIPAIAHIDYPDGRKLRTDLHVFNPAPFPQEIGLNGKPIDTDQWPRGKPFIYLLPYEARVIRDVLKEVFDLEGRARLRYVVGNTRESGPSVRVTARTYLIDPNGGTRGTITPPLSNFQLAAQGETLEIVAPLGPSLQLDLGLIDLSPYPQGDPTIVRITVYDHRGVFLGSWSEHLFAARGLYLEDVFRSKSIAQPGAARIVMEVAISGTLVGAYGTLVDRTTRDMMHLNANRGGRVKPNLAY